jgi:hypothetical protein
MEQVARIPIREQVWADLPTLRDSVRICFCKKLFEIKGLLSLGTAAKHKC